MSKKHMLITALLALSLQISCTKKKAVVNLSNQNIRSLGYRLNAIPGIKYAVVINLSANLLRTLSISLFYGYLGLKHLDVSNNQLKSIPSDLFRGFAGNLVSLDLSNNQLTSFPTEILRDQRMFFKSISLKNNPLSQEEKERIRKGFRTKVKIEF